MKIRLVGAEWFNEDGRAEGRTDVTKRIVVFRNFAIAPKHRQKTVLLKLNIYG